MRTELFNALADERSISQKSDNSMTEFTDAYRTKITGISATSMLILAFAVQSAHAEPKSAPALKIALTEIPSPIDPHRGNEMNLNQISSTLFKGLSKLDNNLVPQSELAQWKIRRSDRAIDFILKDEKCADSRTLTAIDIFNSLKRSSKKGNAIGEFLESFSECTSSSSCHSFQIKNEKEFSVKLKTSNFLGFLRSLASMEGMVVIDRGGKILGCGAYSVTESNPNLLRVSLRNEQSGISSFSVIEFVKVPSERAKNAFEKGDVNVINSLQFEFAEPKHGSSLPVRYMGTMHIAFNLRNGLFKGKNTRILLQSSLNREKIAHALGPDFSGAFTFVPKGMLGFKLPNSPEFKTAVPKPLATRTAVFALNSKYSSNKKLQIVLTEEFAKAGFTLKLKFMPLSECLKALRTGRVDAMLKGDGPQTYDPSTIYTSLVSSSNANVSGHHSPALDALYQRAIVTEQDADKEKIIEEIEAYIRDRALVIPLAYVTFKIWVSGAVLIPNREARSLLTWTFDYPNWQPMPN